MPPYLVDRADAPANPCEPLGDGVHVIDTGFHRPRFDAAYLLVEDGRAAFVDTGTNHSVPRLLAALDGLDIGRDAVDFVIVTHVHLDHAGGAGLLMQALPNARLVVHPRGARHLVDPSHLVRSATGVYGAEEIERSYGRIAGVAADRVLKTRDGSTLELARRQLRFIDTPGHAMHHHCIVDERSGGVFTGDTFGLSYRDFDTTRGAWIMPTTTPVQFQPEALRRSVERIVALMPARLFLTHYGQVVDVPRLARLFLYQLEAMVALARCVAAGLDRRRSDKRHERDERHERHERHERLKRGLAAIHLQSLREHGVTLGDERIETLLALDLELNARGIAVWLDRVAATR